MATTKQREAARQNVKKAQSAARQDIGGRSKMGKSQLIRAVSQKRRTRSG